MREQQQRESHVGNATQKKDNIRLWLFKRGLFRRIVSQIFHAERHANWQMHFVPRQGVKKVEPAPPHLFQRNFNAKDDLINYNPMDKKDEIKQRSRNGHQKRKIQKIPTL